MHGELSEVSKEERGCKCLGAGGGKGGRGGGGAGRVVVGRVREAPGIPRQGSHQPGPRSAGGRPWPP